MRRSLWTGLIVVGAACASPDAAAGPAEPPVEHAAWSEDEGPGVLIEVNTRQHFLTAQTPRSRVAGSADGPNFSLLDGDAIELRVSDYSVSPIGAYTPGMMRVRFQVGVVNRFTAAELIPPELAPDVPPPGVLMLLPLLQQADAGAAPVYTGSDASVIVDHAHTVLVRPSDEWGGGGALGASGYDFAQGAMCSPSSAGCSRWEAYAPLAPGAASGSQTVGFDVAPTVGSFRIRLLLAANLRAVGGAPTPIPPPPTLPAPGELAGIPFGPFHLPARQLGPVYSGLLRTVSPGRIEATLDSVRQRGGRIILAVSRAASSNADKTFNLTYWKWEVDRYRALDLAPYLASGTILGLYIIDEPFCASCWGGETVSQATVDEMARYAKAIWPDMVTIARVTPDWFNSYGPPRHLDAAWAQYEGPLHLPSARQTPEEFRAVQAAAASRLGLGLVLGSNVLDGGDGSSGIPGTVAHYTRFQMTAAEYERASLAFAAEPYACAVVDWRYSSDYPESGVPAEVLPLIRAFHEQPEVAAASERAAAVVRSRANSPCRRR